MKIVFATETFLPSTDGVVTRLMYAVKYLVARGHELIVICPDIDGVPFEYGGAKIYALPAKRFFFYKQRPWGLPSDKVQIILKRFKPNIVHAFNPVSLAASAVYYAKKLNYPLICSYHTNVPDYLTHYRFGFLKPLCWWYIKTLHNQAPINLTTSAAMKKLLESKGIRNVRVLPIGLDINTRRPHFRDKKTRERLSGGESDKKLLLFVGRLAPEKNVESLYELVASRNDIRLAIVGDGPSKEALEQKFKGTPTVFTGFLNGRELAEAYASADAFVFPSTSETLGLVLTEAMASGIPVIAAESGPTVEQITDGINGLIYKQNSLADLNRCVDALNNTELRQKLIENGFAYSSRFSWESVNEYMLSAYKDIITQYWTGLKYAIRE